jgi:hypothetical protein
LSNIESYELAKFTSLELTIGSVEDLLGLDEIEDVNSTGSKTTFILILEKHGKINARWRAQETFLSGDTDHSHIQYLVFVFIT